MKNVFNLNDQKRDSSWYYYESRNKILWCIALVILIVIGICAICYCKKPKVEKVVVEKPIELSYKLKRVGWFLDTHCCICGKSIDAFDNLYIRDSFKMPYCLQCGKKLMDKEYETLMTKEN